MMRKHGLPPILGAAPHLLILGTLPGEQSIRQQRYYAHPRNHFWPLISAVIGQSLPDAYEARVTMLIANHIAVWDVLAAAERTGSLDSALRDVVPNALPDLLATTPTIQTIAFNGQAAQRLFRQHIAPALSGTTQPERVTLTSSSPTNTRTFEMKREHWLSQLSAHYSSSPRRKP